MAVNKSQRKSEMTPMRALVEARAKALDLSLTDVALRAGIRPQHLNHLMRGQDPPLRVCYRLASALQITIWEFVKLLDQLGAFGRPINLEGDLIPLLVGTRIALFTELPAQLRKHQGARARRPLIDDDS